MSHVLTGIAASPGFAIAKAVPLQAEKYVPQRRSIDDVPAETERFRKAVAEAKRELEAIRQSTEERLGPDKAEIFEGHLLLLEDPELIDAAAEQIAEQAVDAEYALYEVSQSFIEALLSLDNELLRGRAVDLQDVAGRVINHLRGVSHTTVSSLLEACIIVAEDLTPSDTAQLNLEIVRGFVTEIGSRTSHSAIMARSLDVPAIVGAGAGVHAIQAGDTVVLDALEGRIVVNPSDAELADYREKQAQYERRKAELARLKDRPTESADGHRVELAANIGSVEDVAKALENGAEAIGLFRTEFLYMGRTSLPTEEEQYNSYKHVLEKMEGKPVVIRTLDIGGDKELPYMSLPKESNPFLGLRALRLCLSREDLFRTQLRALLRASRHGQLKIMFPMISVLDELLEAKRLLQEEKEKLLREGEVVAERIEVGMMIEVPAAAIGADIFASEVDFFQHRHERFDPIHDGGRPDERNGLVLVPAMPPDGAAARADGYPRRPARRQMGRHVRRNGRRRNGDSAAARSRPARVQHECELDLAEPGIDRHVISTRVGGAGRAGADASQPAGSQTIGA